MANRNVEVISDTNYSITDRNRPVKKKRRIFGTITALVFSLFLALFMRYYVEVSVHREVDENKEDTTEVAKVLQESALV